MATTRDPINQMTIPEVMEYMSRVAKLHEVGAPILAGVEEIRAIAKRASDLEERARVARNEARSRAEKLMRTIRSIWSPKELDDAGLDHIE